MDTDTDRVQVLDVDGEGGSWSSEPAAADWWVGAAAVFEADRRQGREPGLRLRWHGGGHFDFVAEANPSPPERVDVIAAGPGQALIRVRLERRDGQVIRAGVEVRDNTGDLTSRLLRGAGVGAVVERIDTLLGSWSVTRILGDPWRATVRRPGRAGRPDLDYALWAVRYLEALRAAPSRPIPWILAAERDRPVLPGVVVDSADQVRAFLRRARERGLLTRVEKVGVAGGRLTAKGRDVLEAAGVDVKEDADGTRA